MTLLNRAKPNLAFPGQPSSMGWLLPGWQPMSGIGSAPKNGWERGARAGGAAVIQFEEEAILRAHRTKPSTAAPLRQRSSMVGA
jgi:hypothetical protein